MEMIDGNGMNSFMNTGLLFAVYIERTNGFRENLFNIFM